jgi:hypothetical protein
MIPKSRIFLGKQKKLVDTRTLQFSKYVTMKYGSEVYSTYKPSPTPTPVLPTAPTALNDEEGIGTTAWTMMGNDKVGDCTVAAIGHLEMIWTKMGGTMKTPTTAQILSAYEAISGYKPSNPNSDVGATCLSVLNYWKKTGIAGNLLGAFTEVTVSNLSYIKDALYLFSGVYVGLEMPLSAETQFESNKPWTVTTGRNARANSWGGHCVPIVAYDATYLYCVTWGQIQAMSWQWFNEYCDEAYCCIDNSYFTAAGKTVQGFNLAQLQTDLKAI